MRSMTAARFLGRYALGERIGMGGVAEVIRATVSGAQGFSKTVVVKRVRTELRENTEVLDAFVREAELARRLVHGNVVQVLDLGTDDDGVPYLVLEHVDGCSLFELRERLEAANEQVPLGVTLHVVEQVGAALQYVHALADDDGMPMGLVHRDVTPKNILLSRDGVVKLTDFGIARATSLGSDTLPGFVKGTPQYLSPEQAAGRPVDERTDVYALGLVLRQMLAADADPELFALADAATEPAVRDRLPTAEVLVARVQSWRVAHGVPVGPDRLAALVRRTGGAPASKRAIALDAALRGDGGAAATRQVAARRPVAARRWPMLLALGTLAIAGTVVVADGSMCAPQRTDEVARGAPEPSEPTPAINSPAPREPDAPVPAVPAEPTAAPTTAPTPVEKRAPERAKKPGRLRVNVVPYAHVTVDGDDWGRTPIDAEIAPGDHTVELYNPESQRRVKKPVRIQPGKPTSLQTW
jgi:serine/threonine-protein kinase